MLYGKIINVDLQAQNAQVEQKINKRVFDFPFDVWQERE